MAEPTSGLLVCDPSTAATTTPRSSSIPTATTSRRSSTRDGLRRRSGAGRQERHREMTRYLISFDDGAMTFPEEELPDVAEAAHKVVYEAKNAGVWIFGGGLLSQRASIVAADGTVTDGPYPETKAVIGGVSRNGGAPPRGGA